MLVNFVALVALVAIVTFVADTANEISFELIQTNFATFEIHDQDLFCIIICATFTGFCNWAICPLCGNKHKFRVDNTPMEIIGTDQWKYIVAFSPDDGCWSLHIR